MTSARPLHMVVMGQDTGGILAAAIERAEDVLLIPPGNVDQHVIDEVLAVSLLAPRIGAVIPRIRGDGPDGLTHEALSPRLPRISYIPWAEPVMLWIDGVLLAEFSEAFAQGVTRQACAEFLLRINRCGYRLAVANRVFLPDVSPIDPLTRSDVLTRFPEAGPLLDRQLASPEHQAIRLLAEIEPSPRRLSILFDLSHLTARYNGTFEAAIRLVRAASAVWPDDIDLIVSAHVAAWHFHGLNALDRPRLIEPGDMTPVGAVIRIGQPYSHPDLERAYTRSPVVAAFLLDTISDDCGYLSLGFDAGVWRFVTQESDLVITNSAYTLTCLEARFPLGDDVASLVSLHSLCVSEYQSNDGVAPPGQRILIVGNDLAHKFVRETVTTLMRAGLPYALSVIGMTPDASLPPEVVALSSGTATESQIESLYSDSSVVVFPSHYEGFGFPIMHALARQRPVFARDTPLNRELAGKLPQRANIHFYDTTAELATRLSQPPVWKTRDVPLMEDAHTWADSSLEILEAIKVATYRVSAARITRRLRRLSDAHIPLKDQLERLPVEERLALRLAPFIRKLLTGRMTGPVMQWLRRWKQRQV